MKKVNLDGIRWVERKSPKGRYHKFRRNIALALEKPGAGPELPCVPPFEVELVRLPPRAKNFPFHSHAAEWEFYLIIAGAGTMRVGRKRVKLKTGDCVLNPPGEPHQIINTGKDDLVYYVVANNAPVDVWHYPDSNKWGWPILGGEIFRKSGINYYKGEE